VKTFDVAIVGGGLIGVSIAFELAAAKLRVVVLDRQEPGREASWAAAGMLSPAPDSLGDAPLVPLARESLRLYPEFVAALEEGSRKSAGYRRDGAMEIFLSPHGEAERDSRICALRELQIAAEPISLATAREWEKSIGPRAQGVAWLPEEGSVEPRSLMEAALAAAQHRGVEVRSNCHVTSLLRAQDRCAGVIAGGERIAASHVVVAAGCSSGEIPFETGARARYSPTRPVRGQMVALRPRAASLRRILRSERGYLVPRRDGRIVAGSTLEDVGFDKRVTDEGVRRILDVAFELCPELAESQLLETWAGLRPGTPDDLPILGPSGIEGLLIATGHYRNGILLAPVTAKLMREWIVEERTAFDAEPFSPLRFMRSEPQPEKVQPK